MHKFSFQIKAEDYNDEQILPCQREEPMDEMEVEVSDKPSVYAFQEVWIKPEMLEFCKTYERNAIKATVNNMTIDYFVAGDYFNDYGSYVNGKDDSIRLADNKHSDLIAGIYEGGGKVWECTNDLLIYISQHLMSDTSLNWQQTLVLDLGCGAGLLGIYAFLHGAHVHFQDYNTDVLELITIPNVLLNAKAIDSNKTCDLKKLENQMKFYSGDWSSWSNHTESNNQYDFIFTSETIYNPANYQKLLNCMYDKLKPDGVILLAAKIFYFGVGGGLRSFETFVNTDQRFQFKVLWSSITGITREIIELRKRKTSS